MNKDLNIDNVVKVAEFEELEPGVTPTLTLNPFDEKEEPMAPIISLNEEKREEVLLKESILTDEEKMMVENFAKEIDLTNSNQILEYGVGTQKKMADFSESALKSVKTKDMGEVGELLTGVVAELKGFDEEEQKGFLGLFRRGSNRIDAIKARHSKAETNVNEIVKALETHQVQLLKDIALLDKMYDTNLAYFKELTMYILAGKKKLEEVRNNELPLLVNKSQETGLAEDAQAARDLDAMCNRFEKKIHDLDLTRTIAMQTAPQIRMVQGNNTLMYEKIQSTVVNTIPLWKSQMVLALGVENSAKAAAAQRQVTDMTNELLRKNADKLKTSSIEAAKESERGIVDMETLKHTNESLISTLDEVMNIQNEGKQKRREAEEEIQRLENELKTKLLEIQEKK